LLVGVVQLRHQKKSKRGGEQAAGRFLGN